VPFFGRPAPFPLGPAMLARATRAPIVPVFMVRDGLRGFASHVEEPTSYFTTHAELMARLKWLDGDATREIAVRGLEPATDAEASTNDVAAAADYGGELLAADAMIDEVPVVAPAPPPAAVTPPPAVAPVTPPAAPPPAAAEEYDAEIAMIFSEEATELLEAAERAFAAFRSDGHDASRVTELKRLLHTLKGGARMAGVTAMGDLSHELESLLTQREAAGGSADPLVVDALQASLDELNRMRDLVSKGLPVARAATLVARIRALVRRVTGETITLYKIGDLIMNLVTREVLRGTRRISLTAREFRLLEHLMRLPGQVVTRTQLIERVWEYHFDPGTNLVDVYIQRLRRKVDDGEEVKLIQTVRGVGYCVRAE